MNFHDRVKSLFRLSPRTESVNLNSTNLQDLPEPVQKYFKYALPRGQQEILTARLTHTGQFKTSPSAAWTDIRGEQYFTVSPPGFIWKGSTRFFTAEDMYINGHGRLQVLLLSFLRIVNGQGSEFDQGELSRWLAENVWFPTNLLPRKNLRWSAIDALHARLVFTYNDIDLCFIVTFNEIGEIRQINTKRYMDKTALEPWIIKISDYKTLNQIRVPTRVSVSWGLKEGEFTYAKFNVQKLEYNKNQLFGESTL
jgi:hypothetical protein